MDNLFAGLRQQIEALAEPLFGVSEMFVRKRGGFLPHGAVLEAGGEVRLIMAAPEDLDASVSPAEILPRLHDALRAYARDHDLVAVAVCEDVTITLVGQKPTKAVKVLVERRRGPTVALLPLEADDARHLRLRFHNGVSAKPEVQPWGDRATI